MNERIQRGARFSSSAAIGLSCAVAALLVVWADAAIVATLHQRLTPELDDLFNRISGLADARVCVGAALAVGAVGLAARPWSTGRRWDVLCERAVRASLLMLLTLLSGGLITLALKHLIGRARPFMLLEQGFYGLAAPFLGAPFNSFPSSHAFTAFAVALVVARVLPAWRLPLMALAIGVSACRVLTLEHFPSDVIASAFIAQGCLAFWAPGVLRAARAAGR